MKRVLLVSAAARLGGAERSLLELAAGLDRSRFSPVVCLPEEGPLSRELSASGVPAFFAPMKRLQRTVNPVKLAHYIRHVRSGSREISEIALSEGAALIHSNTAVAQVYAGEAARRAGLPCIWHARDLLPAIPGLGLGERLASKANLVVASSRTVLDSLLRDGVPEERTRLARNGIDLAPFAEPGAGPALSRAPAEPDASCPARSEARRVLGLGEDDFVVGSAGPFVPWKRHEDFIRAFERLCATELDSRAADGASAVSGGTCLRAVLFGDDIFGENRAYAEDLRRTTDELLGSRLLFTGWRDDLPALLAALDVFVSSSENEPFGRVLVEAMAAGLPVVSTDSGEKGRIVRDGVTGLLVPQGDVDAIAAGLYELLSSPERRESMGARGREVAFAEFDIRRTAGEVQGVYEEVVGGG